MERAGNKFMKNNHFTGLSTSDLDLDTAREQNGAQLKRSFDFRTAFTQLSDGAKPSVDAIRRFCFEEHKLSDFQSAELMRIYTAFRQQRSFEDMIRMYEESDNRDFTGSQIVQEFYAVACNQTGRYSKAIEAAESLLIHGDANGEVYGTLGKAWFKRHEICRDYLDHFNPEREEELIAAYVENFPEDPNMEDVAGNARKAMALSGEYYEDGFLVAFESYPGINAVYSALEASDFKKARRMARLVHLACLRDGARETMDPLIAGTLMEATCIMGGTKAEVQAATEKFLSLDIKETRIQRAVISLEKLRTYYHQQGLSVRPFDLALDGLRTVLKHHGKESFNSAAKKPKKPTLTEQLHKISSSYRGMASNFLGGHFVQGNFMFGGQLPDHYLTRTDWQQFEKLLDAPIDILIGMHDNDRIMPVPYKRMIPNTYDLHPLTLRDITRPEDFLDFADKIVRRAFGTGEDGLEEITSLGHLHYDETVNALLHLSGAENRKEVDSRTNISVMMGLGLGDCRQHAQAKQILFDAWQKDQMNHWLKEAYTALTIDKDFKLYNDCIAKVRDIESVELRTIDALVQAPVEMKGKYEPVYSKEWKLQLNENGVQSSVENHTLTVLLKHNKKGELESLRFADSFYQNHYKWGSGDIPLDSLKTDDKGNLVIPAKTIEAIDPKTGETVSVPVQLLPSRYTGKKDIVSRDEHGKLLLLGLQVEEGFNLADKLTQPRLEKMAGLSVVREWYLKTADLPESIRNRAVRSSVKGTKPPSPNM